MQISKKRLMEIIKEEVEKFYEDPSTTDNKNNKEAKQNEKNK